MKIRKLPLMLSCLMALNTYGQVRKANSPWPLISTQVRPWTRWWWMGSAVDENNIRYSLGAYKLAGIGGVEITPIYGAIGYENRYIDFLSPKWMKMLRFTTATAKEMAMGVDMNTGTGWPFGGPQVSSADAAGKLIVQTYELKKGESLDIPTTVNDLKQTKVAQLQALIAYDEEGKATNLTSAIDNTGRLSFKAPDKVKLYAVFAGKTLQRVKRAAPGGEGWVMDHFSENAVNTYLNRFSKAFAGSNYGVNAFFNDSYEVFGADWSSGLLEQFNKDHHYRLEMHIRELMRDDQNDTVARVKSDYRETISNMLLLNFTQNWTAWAHGLKSISRNQAHGSPGNLLDLYAAADVPECETYGSSVFDIAGIRREADDVMSESPDPLMYRFASSAAHVNGKSLASSETFTWLTDHFKTSFSQCKPEVENLFLAGINHVFFHGTTYSPADAKWPGWLFYAATNMVPNNSLWPHIKGMNEYIARCQSVLQAGRADNDLLIYWPVYDAWSSTKRRELLMSVSNIKQWLWPTDFYKGAKLLVQKGYGVDYGSDNALLKSSVEKHQLITHNNASTYKTLVVPACKFMPPATLKQIINLAQNGATVIFQQLPQDVPGFGDIDVRRKDFQHQLSLIQPSGSTIIGKGLIIVNNDITAALDERHIKPERLAETGLQYIRRDVNGNKYYYIVNHTARDIDTLIPINTKAAAVLIMNPLNGDWGKATTSENNGMKVHVQLKSGDALILYVSLKSVNGKQWTYLKEKVKEIALKGSWTLQFTKGGPVLPQKQQLRQLHSWTTLPDTNAVNFSGTAEYGCTFNLPAKSKGEYVLSLGEVDESAHVWVNGQDAGILWSIPFQCRIGHLLKNGTNTLKIEVCNLMANRIRYMDRNHITWRNYHEINFVNVKYKPFDASQWQPMPSGLIGPVKLLAYKI